MKKILIGLLILVAGSQIGVAQKAVENGSKREAAHKAWRELIREVKSQEVAMALIDPTIYQETASFGRNAKFLGSLRVGTLYISTSCDPAVLGFELQPYDKCVVYTPSGTMANIVAIDDLWQTTIPGRSADNVVQPMLTHLIQYDSDTAAITNPTPYGRVECVYLPGVRVVSSALDDPRAVLPDGTPMNGSLGFFLPGIKIFGVDTDPGELINISDNYAAIGDRGISRRMWESLGLPEQVINNIYRNPMTLKFSLRVIVRGDFTFGQFSYGVRLLGN